MLKSFVVILFLLFSCHTFADIVMKSASEVKVYSPNYDEASYTGNWPENSLLSVTPVNEYWLKVTGIFQQNSWIALEQPIFVKQSEKLTLIADVEHAVKLNQQQFENAVEIQDVAEIDKLSLEKWQQKQFFQKWVNSLSTNEFKPQPLIDFQEHDSLKSVYKLSNLATNASLKLNGNKSSIEFTFGTRLDRAVDFAELDLEFMFSPSLVDPLSQVKVYLNDEVVDVLSTPTKTAGKIHQKKIKLPSHQFRDFNRIKFELLGYYEPLSKQCYDPTHQSIWFELLSSSALTLKELSLPLKNDLSLLPAPFFDERDIDKPHSTIILPEQLNAKIALSSGKVASWLGAESAWRGHEFTVVSNQLPDASSIVLATNDNKPYFLKDYPDVDKPTVVMATHPFHSDLKLLLILGKDEEQLLIASEGLALGHENMSGQAAEVLPINYIKKMEPYQAPLWVNNERPMKLSEFVKDDSELRREGVYLSPVAVNLHIPADLFIWETNGVPVDLNYRYTPPNDPENSMLNVKVNGTLVESFPLNDGNGVFDGGNRIRMPFSDKAFTMNSELLIPSFQLGIQNVMEFDFILKENTESCIGQPTNKFVQVDYNSTMDFSGFEHYAEMPNLSSLAYSGLPFTRLADLSETLIILPEEFTTQEIQTLLTMLARFSAVTGYPANKMEVVTVNESFEPEDKDIIYLNAYEADIVDDNLGLNALVNANTHSLNLSRHLFKDQHLSQRRFLNDTQDEPFVSITNQYDGNVAVVAEFESPYSRGRSVLSVMASQSDSLALVSELFADGSKSYQMKGSVLLLHENKIHHSTVGEKYYTGNLPILLLTKYHLSKQPYLLLSVVIFTVMLLTILAWRVLKHFSRKRIEE